MGAKQKLILWLYSQRCLFSNTRKVHDMTIFPLPTSWAWIGWRKFVFRCRKLTVNSSVWNRVYRVFAESTASECIYCLFQMNKKEITKFDVDFKKFFCWRSNLSRMLTNNFLEVRSANGCEKCHFWSETGPGIPGFISNCQNFLAEPSRETRSFSGLSARAVRANPVRIRKKLRCPWFFTVLSGKS